MEVPVGMIPLREAARRWGIPSMRLYNLERQNRIPGVKRVGCHIFLPMTIEYDDVFGKKAKNKPKIKFRYCRVCEKPFKVIPARPHHCSYACAHKHVLDLYYQLGTLEAVGQRLGISRERVRVICSTVDPDYRSKKKKEEVRICPVCKVNPIPKSHGNTRSTCSKACRDRYYRERTEKRCNTCKKVKPIHCFALNRRTNEGHQTRCQECTADQQARRTQKLKEGLIPHKAPGGGKVCPACKVFKEWREYSRCRSSNTGYQPYCKKCQAEKQRASCQNSNAKPKRVMQPKKSLKEMFEERKAKEKELALRWNLEGI